MNTKAPIHYIPDYADGLVARLVWSPEIQQAVEQAAAARREKTAERERLEKRAKLPLSSMRDWAAKRGLGESERSKLSDAGRRPLSARKTKHPATKNMTNYDYSRKGQKVTIKPGAHDALHERGWHRGVAKSHDGEGGTIGFEFGEGTGSHHISVNFAEESVGYPPEFVEREATHIDSSSATGADGKGGS